MSMRATDTVGAIVTVYHPARQALEKLLNGLKLLSRVVIVKNDAAEVDRDWWAEMQDLHSNMVVIQMPHNRGIAPAINAGAELLARECMDYLWLFDQDSHPTTECLSALLNVHAHDEVGGVPGPTAAVVPRVMDAHRRDLLPYLVLRPNGRVGVAPYRADACILAAITAGMLIPMTSWKAIGPMNEALFMDHVDTEWCLRARALGFHIHVAPQALMDHELGNPQEMQCLGLRFTRRTRPPERTYSMIRNGWLLQTLPYAPSGWARYAARQSLLIAANALLWGPDRLQQSKAIVRALCDARRNPLLCPTPAQ